MRPTRTMISSALLLGSCYSPNSRLVPGAGTDASSSSSSGVGTGSESTSPTGSDDTSAAAVATSGDSSDSSSDGAGSEVSSTEAEGGGPSCGDGMPDEGEACDDGNEIDGDGCNTDCVVSGTLLWEVLYGAGPGAEEEVLDLAIGPTGTLALVGISDDESSVGWVRTYDGDGVELDAPEPEPGAYFGAVGFLSDGDLAISVGDPTALALRRMTTAGATLWTTSVPDSDSASSLGAITSIAVTATDDIAGAATIYESIYGGTLWGGKIDADGDFLWDERYLPSAPGYARGRAIACAGDGTCVLAGDQDTNGISTEGGYGFWLRRLSNGGGELWTRTVDALTANARVADVAIGPAGEVVVIGTIDGPNGSRDVWARRYTSDGAVDWTLTYDDPNGDADLGADVAIDGAGAIVLVGSEVREDLGEGFNAWIAKVDAEGDERWMDTLNGSADGGDGAVAVAIDANGRVFVVGNTDRSDVGEGNDVWLRAYAP